MKLRQILRRLGKTQQGKVKLRELIERYKYRLEEQEYKILKLAYLDKELRDKTCLKLNISRATYQNLLNITLSRLEALISDTILRELILIM